MANLIVRIFNQSAAFVLSENENEGSVNGGFCFVEEAMRRYGGSRETHLVTRGMCKFMRKACKQRHP
jgi:hypothetical protein